MTTELKAILDGTEMGLITRDKRAKLSFTYNEEWRNAENAYPLSISMPLALTQHGHARIDPFLWGLLPDDQMVLDQWARRFHVSARNAFSLISVVGEDCAGAVQFVRPERLERDATPGARRGEALTVLRVCRKSRRSALTLSGSPDRG